MSTRETEFLPDSIIFMMAAFFFKALYKLKWVFSTYLSSLRTENKFLLNKWDNY